MAVALPIAAVVSAATGLYLATRPTPEIKFPETPAPANYYTYDEQGNKTGEQVWNKEKNGYEYRPYPKVLTEAEQKEKTQRDTLRTQLLSNLSQAPEDRVAAYENYAKSLRESMRAPVEEQYGKVLKSTEESLEARGLTGGRAEVDIKTELAKEKLKAEGDIALKAALGKETLAASDREFWMNLLTQLEQGQKVDVLKAVQDQQLAMTGSQSATSALMQEYSTKTTQELAKWQSQMEQNRALTEALAGLSGSLGMMYAYGKKSPLTSVGDILKSPTYKTKPTTLKYQYGNLSPLSTS